MPRRRSQSSELERAAFVERLLDTARTFGSLNALAKASGVSEGALRKWTTGQSEPTRDRLVAIARTAGVNVAWLATGNGPRDRAGAGEVPLLEGYVRLGECFQGEGPALPDVAFSTTWIERHAPEGAENLGMAVMPDDSMIPHLPAGTLLVVQDTKKQVRRDGIYAFMLGPHLTVRRLQRLPSDEIEASASNPAYQPFRIREDDSRNLLLGRVIWAGREL